MDHGVPHLKFSMNAGVQERERHGDGFCAECIQLKFKSFFCISNADPIDRAKSKPEYSGAT